MTLDTLQHPALAELEVEQITTAVRGRFDAGDPMGGIALATAASKRVNSPELERRLILWRIEAYDLLPRSSGRDHWPPSYKDIFPDVTGLPAVDARDLNADVLGSAIVNHGALWVRGLISRDQADQLKADIESARAARNAHYAGTSQDDDIAWYAQTPVNPNQRLWVEEGDGVRTTDSPRAALHLIEFFEQAGLIDTIGGFLGERPALSVLKSTLRKTNPDAGTDWHQDGRFLGSEIRSVNVWLGLSDCGDDAPGLDVVGRRIPYVLQSGSHGSIFDWAVGPNLVGVLAEGGAEIFSPRFSAGDAVLFDHLMLHRTGVRPGMTKSRWAVESWFFAPSVYPMEQVPVAI